MSGDNIHGRQPLKFYSNKMTATKMLLISLHKANYHNESINYEFIDGDEISLNNI